MRDIHIPDDILNNVLARLPRKPLLHSRCVSKHWNLLISDPYFMKSRSRRKLLLFTSRFYPLDGSLADNLAHFPDSLSQFSKFQSSIYTSIAGTLNGIVLFLVPDDNAVPVLEHITPKIMVLYNPFTGASKIVPDPYSTSTAYHHLYGFCYGETHDDLKIVRFRDCNQPINYNWKTCDVFDLKTSVWSTSEIPILDAEFNDTYVSRSHIGIFIKGILYWVASKKIVALGVEDMVISYVPLPAVPYHINNVWGTLHGFFCMITKADIPYNFNVWVMKEHGVENPWSKVHSFRLQLEKLDCFGGCQVLNTMDDGRILMLDCSGNVVILDTLKHSYKRIATNRFGVQSCIDTHAIEYDESLVSLSDICGF